MFSPTARKLCKRSREKERERARARRPGQTRQQRGRQACATGASRHAAQKEHAAAVPPACAGLQVCPVCALQASAASMARAPPAPARGQPAGEALPGEQDTLAAALGTSDVADRDAAFGVGLLELAVLLCEFRALTCATLPDLAVHADKDAGSAARRGHPAAPQCPRVSMISSWSSTHPPVEPAHG